jgi:hypothetical protein
MKQPHPRTNYHASAWHRVSWCSWCCQKKKKETGLKIFDYKLQKGRVRNGPAFFYLKTTNGCYQPIAAGLVA